MVIKMSYTKDLLEAQRSLSSVDYSSPMATWTTKMKENYTLANENIALATKLCDNNSRVPMSDFLNKIFFTETVKESWMNGAQKNGVIIETTIKGPFLPLFIFLQSIISAEVQTGIVSDEAPVKLMYVVSSVFSVLAGGRQVIAYKNLAHRVSNLQDVLIPFVDWEDDVLMVDVGCLSSFVKLLDDADAFFKGVALM
jgi:hypothetical protein